MQLAALPAHSALVATPLDMARLLLRCSAANATPYALAAHEEACESADQDRAAFWMEVCRDLKTLRSQVDRAA